MLFICSRLIVRRGIGAYDGKRSGRIRSTARFWMSSRRSRTRRCSPAATSSLSGDSNPERVRGEVVTDRYPGFSASPLSLGAGLPAPKRIVRASSAVVMIGHALWTRRYNADPAIVGRTIQINSAPYTVVGVLPPGFQGAERQCRGVGAVRRLRTGVSDSALSHGYYLVARRKASVIGGPGGCGGWSRRSADRRGGPQISLRGG